MDDLDKKLKTLSANKEEIETWNTVIQKLKARVDEAGMGEKEVDGVLIVGEYGDDFSYFLLPGADFSYRRLLGTVHITIEYLNKAYLEGGLVSDEEGSDD